MKHKTKALINCRPTPEMTALLVKGRNALNLTQTELIDYLQHSFNYKVSVTTISCWENGKTYPPNMALDIFAEAFSNPELNQYKRMSIEQFNALAGELDHHQQRLVLGYIRQLVPEILKSESLILN